MNLREKLKKLDKNYRKHPGNKQHRDSSAARNISRVIEGKKIENDRGDFFLTEQKYKLNFKHGLHKLGDIKQLTQSKIQALTGPGPSPAEDMNFTYRDLLFLDTETTGLMGGTGTLPFLIGAGFFQNNSFIIKQFFMRDFDDEPALLPELRELGSDYPVIISFNGKSYDLPILKTRFILNRLPELNFKLHLDLLHSSRRIWNYLDSCALTSIENNILDISRENDLDGSQVPAAYFDYLEGKNPHLLPRIFKHNALDIITLVSLLLRLTDIYTYTGNKDSRLTLKAGELFNLGKLLEKRNMLNKSIKIYREAKKAGNSAALRRKINIKLSRQYKRAGEWNRAISIWKAMITCKSGGIFPFRELAKYYEHRKNNYRRARKYTRQALSFLQKNRPIINDFGAEKQKLEHRLQRLNRKINRSARTGQKQFF